MGGRTGKLGDEWRPSKLQHCWERPEYFEESWRLEESCCQSNTNEIPSAKTDWKNSLGVKSNTHSTKQVLSRQNKIADVDYVVIETKQSITYTVKESIKTEREYTIKQERTGKVIHWELCKKFKFEYTTKSYMNHPESVLKKWDAKKSFRFCDTNRLSNLVQTNSDSQHKIKENLQNSGLVCTCWPHGKTERKRKDSKYTELAREQKKLWNMILMMIPIVIDAFGTVNKRLIKRLEVLEIRRQIETMQTTALLKSPRILRRVLQTWRDLPSLRLPWKTIS